MTYDYRFHVCGLRIAASTSMIGSTDKNRPNPDSFVVPACL
jgi:hypothetical protein